MPQPRLFGLAWPLFVELLLGIGIGLLGTALAARESDASGAAFSLANHVASTLFIVFRIVGAGVGVVITQRLGAGQTEAAHRTARAALGASTWIGGASALVAWWGAAPLMQLMGAPADVAPLAVPFLALLAPSLLGDALNAAMASVMRAHLRTQDTLAVITAMHALHLLLVVPLMARLGLAGFAIAVLLSRLLGVGLHLWLWRRRLNLAPRWSDLWRVPRGEFLAMLHIGLPGAAENIAYRLAFLFSVAMAAQMGSVALATQAYASQLMYGVLLFGLATGLAAEILVGHMVGAGALHEANRMVRRALACGLGISLVVAAAMALAAPWLLRAFSNDPAIIDAGTTLLWMTVILEPGRTFNLVLVNALRAAGDARYPVAAGALSMAVVLAGGSWLFGVHLAWGLPGLWLAYAADEWIRGLLMWHRWTTLGWVPHARRSRNGHRAQSLR